MISVSSKLVHCHTGQTPRPKRALIRPSWVAHRGHHATENIGSGKCYGRVKVWTMVAQGSDQKLKSGHSLDHDQKGVR